MALFCCLSCAISELVSRSGTTEITGFVGGEGIGFDADGVLDGIGEPLAGVAQAQGRNVHASALPPMPCPGGFLGRTAVMQVIPAVAVKGVTCWWSTRNRSAVIDG